MCDRNQFWSQEFSVSYVQVWIWHFSVITSLLLNPSTRSRKKRSSLRLFSHRLMKGPGSSAVLKIRMKTKGKWRILVWCILIIVFYLTDGIQYDEPSVGYGVASGSDQGRANWIDRSIGLQKHRSVWPDPYLNRKGLVSGLYTGENKTFWLLSLIIKEDSTTHLYFIENIHALWSL